MIDDRIVGFASWADVLAYAATGAPLYYRAPLDARATRLTAASDGKGGRRVCTYVPRARTVRIYPPGCLGRGRGRTADPFTADAGHLARFSYPADRSVDAGCPEADEHLDLN